MSATMTGISAREILPEPMRASALDCEFVGSRVTCNPAPTDTDLDILVRVKSMFDAGEQLGRDGYKFCGSLHDSQFFQSARKGEVNIIYTCDVDFYERFMAAHSVAKRLNLLKKDDRIALFRAVLYSEQSP